MINWYLLFLVLCTSLQYILELVEAEYVSAEAPASSRPLCLLWEADFSDIYSRLFDFLRDGTWCVLYFTNAQVGSLWTIMSCQVYRSVCVCQPTSDLHCIKKPDSCKPRVLSWPKCVSAHNSVRVALAIVVCMYRCTVELNWAHLQGATQIDYICQVSSGADLRRQAIIWLWLKLV